MIERCRLKIVVIFIQTRKSALTKVEFILSILQISWKYTSKAYLKYNSSMVQVYFDILNYKRRRSVFQVYNFSAKGVHLKHTL